MAVRDLLWACPLCRLAGGIRRDGRRDRCTGCGTVYRRATGAVIVAERTGGERVGRSAGDWLGDLKAIELPRPGPEGRILGPEAVRVKATCGQELLRWNGRPLGWVERYGPRRTATLTLLDSGLVLRLASGKQTAWSFTDITGVQPASSTLQVAAGRDVVSISFPFASVRLWARTLIHALRTCYAGQGLELLEFQPRIRTCSLQES